MATPQNIPEEELLYYKGLYILQKAIIPELRRLFKLFWQRREGNPWQDQTSGKLFFKKYRPKATGKQYDDRIKTGNVDDWNLTLLCRAFIDYTLEEDDVRKHRFNVFRELQNVYSHKTRCSREEYEEHIRQIRLAFRRLHLNEADLTQAEEIEPNETERQELLSEIQLLNQERDKFAEEVFNKLFASDRDTPDKR
ncbi:uncharacterized protein LOC124279766 [Haliotis rubra]|uniref:uncharacterized protein LOC124279766 n=1 Tax=Haliotis rubra TaxID=36100 RepID=UPI001EE540E1|nr:uncharacterized protein LOC124279766 [Haliotis rubra]